MNPHDTRPACAKEEPMTDEEIKRVLAEIDNLTTPSGKDEIIRRLAREVERLRELVTQAATRGARDVARAERAERDLAEARAILDYTDAALSGKPIDDFGDGFTTPHRARALYDRAEAARRERDEFRTHAQDKDRDLGRVMRELEAFAKGDVTDE